MHFSPPTLHPSLVTTDEQRDLVRGKVKALIARRPKPAAMRAADGSPVSIPLTTVSRGGNFDAYIQVQFPNPGAGEPMPVMLLVDSGNTMMIIPYSEAVFGVEGYKCFGATTEPWGCPAYVMQGPLQIPTAGGHVYQIDNCVFLACYGDNPNGGGRTANFGTGRVVPWPSNTPGPSTIQSPFSYDTAYPCAEFLYAPAATMLSDQGTAQVSEGSMLVLHASAPTGYTMMNIIPNVMWMSVVPTSLTIGGTVTDWPGDVPSPIALVDTGGGPVMLSDPKGYIYPKRWPDTVNCPAWAVNGNCISDRLEIGLAQLGGFPSYTYTIDTGAMPKSVQGLTAVMFGVSGDGSMNTGGITALFNHILIDYAGKRVGFRPKYDNSIQTIEIGSSVDQAVAMSPPGVLLGYDFYEQGRVVGTTMTVSWSGLPEGACLFVTHGGSSGAEILAWSGPDSSTASAGRLDVWFSVLRTEGAAVPVWIFAYKDVYLPLNFQLTATAN